MAAATVCRGPLRTAPRVPLGRAGPQSSCENANAFLVPASGNDPDAAAKRWL